MRRPDPLESRYEGPWYREARGLGNRPHNAIPKKKQIKNKYPRGVVPSLGPPTPVPGHKDRQDADHYK